MKRRTVLGYAAACLAQPVFAQTKRPALIGLLITGSAPYPLAAALPRELGALGYREGRDFVLDVRYADRRNDRALELAAEMVKESPDVIVANFTPAAEAVHTATKTIPIVMAPVGAPIEAGLVTTLARPGGNVTGITNLGIEIGGRRMQVLRDLVPSLKTLAAITAGQDPFSHLLVDELLQVGKPVHVRVEPIFVEPQSDLEKAFEAVDKISVQAVLLSGLSTSQRPRALQLAARRKLAVMTMDVPFVREGALVCVQGSETEIYRRTASFVDRILHGAKPADLPVEQPTATYLIINLRVARELGIAIPLALRAAADELIE